jgi:hypothetical protein
MDGQSVTAAPTEYTDEQFEADLRKAGPWLKRMAADASAEYAAGKTQRFPPPTATEYVTSGLGVALAGLAIWLMLKRLL